MFELILLAPCDGTVSDALEALDALSASVEDADAHTSRTSAVRARHNPCQDTPCVSSRLQL
jgi:hypothetical protein